MCFVMLLEIYPQAPVWFNGVPPRGLAIYMYWVRRAGASGPYGGV